MKPVRLLFLCFWFVPAVLPAALTLRALGAKGDGTTDDRAAILTALREHPGETIDGEGLTYAVKGNIEVAVAVDLQNLTLKQTAASFDTSRFIRSTGNKEAPKVTPPEALRQMVQGLPLLRHDGVATYAEDPVVTGADREALRAMLNIRTLFIHGSEGKRVPVKLRNVKVLRGSHADAGMHSNAAGLYLVNAAPLTLEDVEITGDGKGSGLFVHHCAQVRIRRLNIHDILWAPYQGDVAFTAALLAKEFGWNNSPIYDFRERTGTFVRVRVQEQLTGMTLADAEDVEITDSRIERIGTRIEGKFVPWQADGLTVSAVKNFTMKDCVITGTWEGIDFTGRGVDGFLQENIRISDSFSYGFKYAHPQKNGRVVNCVAERSGFKGFTIGSECHNIEFIGCAALETGAGDAWRREGRAINGIAGFDVSFDEGHSPTGILLQACRAENVRFPQAMEFGFRTSDRARNPKLGIRLESPKVAGATIRAVDGFPPP